MIVNWPCLTPLEPVMELNDCSKLEWIFRRNTNSSHKNHMISAEPKPFYWSTCGLAVHLHVCIMVHVHKQLMHQLYMYMYMYEVKWGWICTQVCPKTFSYHILSILIVNHSWRETFIMYPNSIPYCMQLKWSTIVQKPLCKSLCAQLTFTSCPLQAIQLTSIVIPYLFE